ncbi:MAG: type I DNA topoisomerase [Alphaproteobacteria bacterium]|nr:type I DNA topoisomerase [Alphaproteobacteria bacterium]
MQVVVVESPAKAKTLNKYLGQDYVVLASYGHVRDLPSKDGSVKPDENFEMIYEVDPGSAKHLAAIAKALVGAERLILATDPDREGEAISWHVLEALREKKKLDSVAVERVVFNEITQRAVLEAMAHPRELDMDLVDAQQARRALDYLVGFTLSPVLWRKLPGARSAGRVQSVALRLICERENEIEVFQPREYWSIEAIFQTDAGESFSARLTHLGTEKLDKFSLADEAAAMRAVQTIVAASDFRAAAVETKPTRRHPQPPFTTSTLQQEASRKLGFGASRTMQLAQRLYEGADIGGETVGLITYMRTDGVQMAEEAIAACRSVIGERFGAAFVPAEKRVYRSRAKNAQEAHEAIRPTDLSRLPDDLGDRLDRDQWRLYELIWKRALASQMESARLQRTTIDIRPAEATVTLRATGTVVEFPGFLKLYEEGRDDTADDGGEDARRLPKIAVDAALARDKVTPEQHFTEPPPRYSEATLVRKLEELGIGRPSTYASILSVLQERNYVVLERKRFMPEDKGRLVTAFLESYFRRYVEYGFTADLERKLDEVSAGQMDWHRVLEDFWREFSAAVGETTELRVREVLDAVNDLLAPYLYPEHGQARTCPGCNEGSLSLKGGRFGFFVGCSNYPECRYTRPLTGADKDADEAGLALDGPKELGMDPESGLLVTMRKGPFGLYLQLGEPEGEEKPKRASVPKDVAPETVDLGLALQLLALPREVGPHPDTGKPISAGIGRYGPFLKLEGRYARLASTEEVLTVGLNRAVTVLAEAAEAKGGRRGSKELRALGEHPDDGAPVAVMEGRYGPYVKHGRINATLPKDKTPDEITLEEALVLLAERAARAGAKKKGRGGAKGGAKSKAKGKTKAKAKSKAKPKAQSAAAADAD